MVGVGLTVGVGVIVGVGVTVGVGAAVDVGLTEDVGVGDGLSVTEGVCVGPWATLIGTGVLPIPQPLRVTTSATPVRKIYRCINNIVILKPKYSSMINIVRFDVYRLSGDKLLNLILHHTDWACSSL
jgi:hypothetical protein